MGDGYEVNAEELSLRASTLWLAIQSSGRVFVDFWRIWVRRTECGGESPGWLGRASSPRVCRCLCLSLPLRSLVFFSVGQAEHNDVHNYE